MQRLRRVHGIHMLLPSTPKSCRPVQIGLLGDCIHLVIVPNQPCIPLAARLVQLLVGRSFVNLDVTNSQSVNRAQYPAPKVSTGSIGFDLGEARSEPVELINNPQTVTKDLNPSAH